MALLKEVEQHLGKAIELSTLVDYSTGSVVSKQLIKGEKGNITLFAFDKGEGLSEHSAPFTAFVMTLDGKAHWTVGGQSVVAEEGHSVFLPANVPHSVHADEPFKMMLVMIRE